MGDELLLVSPQQMRSEARRIAEQAQQAGVTLRLIGALAFEHQCPGYNHLRQAMGRELSDLDFVALSKQWDQVVHLLTGMGYSFDERHAMLHGADRIIFFHPEGFRVDIFLDRLNMCHIVDFRGRLHIDPVTISVTDLLLEKLQIVELTRKDVVDTIVLLREHEVDQPEAGINTDYVARRFSTDWGFYYTATENLKHIRDKSLVEFDALAEEDRTIARERIERLLDRVEAEPKSLIWRIRAAIGPRLRWYKPVGALSR
jgi:hypothetical protein